MTQCIIMFSSYIFFAVMETLQYQYEGGEVGLNSEFKGDSHSLVVGKAWELERLDLWQWGLVARLLPILADQEVESLGLKHCWPVTLKAHPSWLCQPALPHPKGSNPPKAALRAGV